VADSRIDDLRRRLERDPGSRVFAQLAEEHRKAGEHAEAIRVARAGLALHPAYPSARLTLGRALLDSGDAAGARTEFEVALRDAPDNILASRFLGQALEALGELGPALQQLEKTLKMAPGDRQLEAQVVALRARLRSSIPASPPTPPARAVAAAALPEEGSLPPTIPIYRPEDRRAAGTPPPLPWPSPVATSASTTMPAVPPPPALPRPVPASPPGPPAPSAGAPGQGPLAPERVPEVPPEAEPLPPTVPPGPLTVEETVFEAEAGPEGGREGVPSGAAARAWAEDVAAAEATPFSSSTLAELYFRQGLVERAAEVYRQLVADDPENVRARARLEEIARDLPADSRTARRRALERTIARLEALLAAVGRGRA
jgi:tetratricopeptide (TPR) repeat protein